MPMMESVLGSFSVTSNSSKPPGSTEIFSLKKITSAQRGIAIERRICIIFVAYSKAGVLNQGKFACPPPTPLQGHLLISGGIFDCRNWGGEAMVGEGRMIATSI